MSKTVQVSYNTGLNTIQLNPDPVVADKGTQPTIFWALSGNQIRQIDDIRIQGWSGPSQPTAIPGSTSWQVADPNSSKKDFKYDMDVTLTNGSTKSIDPTIQNNGQGP